MKLEALDHGLHDGAMLISQAVQKQCRPIECFGADTM